MWITYLELKFINWQNSGTNDEFCRCMIISRTNVAITLTTINGKGEKVFEKVIKLSSRELSVMCGLIRINDDLHWRKETYISDEGGIVIWQMMLMNENRKKYLIGNADFPEGWENLIKYSSRSFSNEEDGFELRKFLGFLYKHERKRL